ncbi:MAG: DUF1800 domain-containing protein [Xanthomonadaceae bacterium]|jgi:uncharacterized protein (DUF1800 family)|nr:DUF1800 domain-containing protein [Xanthomonadaceae bacterium]
METATRAGFGALLGGEPLAAGKSDDASLPPPDPVGLLLSRTSFGVREEELQAARRAGYDAWLEAQLAPERIDTSALESQIAANLPTVAMSNGQIIALARESNRQFQAADELRAATILRQAYSPAQLFEVMVEFWTNHFNVNIGDGAVRFYKSVDDREIRRHAMGRFADLLKANARSPAMLFYLDNYLNVATGPNENYARELMELHTLGVDGGYTEDDVKAVARAFTGWTFTPYNPAAGVTDVQFVFVRSRHDTRAKRVLGVDLPAGRGIEDGDAVLDMLANHPSTARFIARKLLRRFVADAPAEALVERIALVFRQTGGDIRALLRAILSSDEFKASGDDKLKRPVEYAISALRATNAQLTGNWIRALAETLNTLGQLHFAWPAPNGYPDVGGYWVNSSSLLTRFNYALALGEGTIGNGIRVDIAALLGAAPRTPEQIVDRLTERVLRRALLPLDRAVLVNYAAAGGPPNAAIADAALRQRRAREVLGVMLGSTYFMYR